MSKTTTQQKRLRIKRKIRASVFGTQVRPRLSIFRSNNSLYAQLINDEVGTTIVAVSDHADTKGTKVERAARAGAALAKLAAAKGVTTVVFDRNGFRYAGRIKTFADAAREGGLIF